MNSLHSHNDETQRDQLDMALWRVTMLISEWFAEAKARVAQWMPGEAPDDFS